MIVRRHRIELPLYIGAQFNQFYLDVGFRFVLKENLQLRKHAVADGNVITENYGAVNYGYLRYVPSATLGYRFHTNAGMSALLLLLIGVLIRSSTIGGLTCDLVLLIRQ
ncbi:MAG: hypothetical protein IPH53_02485 [Flavobacteriales bacterium]|nr:hypothetical protein [Flavobacteriales bacterium]